MTQRKARVGVEPHWLLPLAVVSSGRPLFPGKKGELREVTKDGLKLLHGFVET